MAKREVPNEEDIGRAVLKLARPPEPGEPVYRGTVMAADDTGAKRLPWYRSVTDKDGRVKKWAKSATVAVDPVRKRSDLVRAEDLALRFVNHLKKKELLLGRPLTTEDLTPEEFSAFGLDLWRMMGNDLNKKVPDFEFFKQVAGAYLQTQGKMDARWTPSGQGYMKPKPERWKEK